MWALGSSNTSPTQPKSLREKNSEDLPETASDVSTLESFLPSMVSGVQSASCVYSGKDGICSRPPCALASRVENNNTLAEHRNLPMFPYVDHLLSTEELVRFRTTVDNLTGSEKPGVTCSAHGNHLLSSHRVSSTVNLLSFSDSRSDDQLDPKDIFPPGHESKCKILDADKHCFVTRKLLADENDHEGDGKRGHTRDNTDGVTQSPFSNEPSIPFEPLKCSPLPFFTVGNKSTSVVFLCHRAGCCDAQGLSDASNSIGGHHFSITHGGVFMKESCSRREENFYRMLVDYQMELVKERVRQQSLKSYPEHAWSEELWEQYCDYEYSRLRALLGMGSASLGTLGKDDHQGSSLSVEVLESMQRSTVCWWRTGGCNSDNKLHIIKSCKSHDKSDKQSEQQLQSSGSMSHKVVLSSLCAGKDESPSDAAAAREEDRYVERHSSLRLLARFAPRFYGVRDLIKRRATAGCCGRRSSDSPFSSEEFPHGVCVVGDRTQPQDGPASDLEREGKIGDEATTRLPHNPLPSSPVLDAEKGPQTTSSMGSTKTTGERRNPSRRDRTLGVDPLHSDPTVSSTFAEYQTSTPSPRLQIGLSRLRGGAGWLTRGSAPNSTAYGDFLKGEESERTCRMIVLEDVCYGFKYPCVLDVKIGSRQYGLHASPVKKESKERKSRLSTSARHYIRLAGIKMWDTACHAYVTKTKLYCRSLSLNQVRTELSQFLSYDRDLGLAFCRHIEELRETMQRQKAFRFYTSSLLFIYDAARPVATARIIMIDFAYTYEKWELVEGDDPDAAYAFDEGYIKALDTLISLIS